jgi:hypothetical protein
LKNRVKSIPEVLENLLRESESTLDVPKRSKVKESKTRGKYLMNYNTEMQQPAREREAFDRGDEKLPNSHQLH